MPIPDESSLFLSCVLFFVQLKSGLLALRDRDQTFSPALFAVSTANSAAAAAAANRNEEPSELALPPIADDKEQKKKDYSKVIEGIIKQGVIRHEDEQVRFDARSTQAITPLFAYFIT